MNSEIKILVVDDEPLNRTIVSEFLEDKYELLSFAEDGETCLAVLETDKPDIILLDVSMPGIDGYEVCKRVNANPDWQDIIVIFVSARGTPEERMEGFKSGGEDYIVKPFSELELLSKIEATVAYKQRLADLESRLGSAQNIAFEAMTSSSEMGTVVQFLEQLFSLNTIEDIVEAVLSFTETLGLKACVRARLNSATVYKTYRGAIAPLEQETIELLQSSGRIYRFDRRSQFNFSHINLLIKDMPIDEENKYGRFTDLLPIALGVADSCISTLAIKLSAAQKEEVEEKIKSIDELVESITTQVNDVKVECNSALESLIETVEVRVPFMGLEDDQEEQISTSTDLVIQTVNSSLQKLELIEQSVKSIQLLAKN